MRKLLVILFVLVNVNIVNAQWNAQISNSTNPLSAVDFSDSNNGWVGGFDLIYTNDGGVNWLDPVFPAPILFYMNANQTRDIKVFNSLKMIGVGQNNISNASIIFSTFDGGVTWDTLKGRNGYGHNSIDFSTSQKGYVCGYYGQFFETLDGGVTWAQVPIIPNTDWFKINFQNQDTGVVVGYNYTMKTFNGGNLWTSNPNSIVLYDVQVLENNTCISIGYDANSNGNYCLFKSYDYGVNWIKITNIPFTPTYIKRLWAFSEDSILLPSKGIMNSYRNGFWHSYPSTQLINMSNEFEDIDFVDDTVGYAVGNNGQIYKTTNAFADEAPYSFFTPDTMNVCQNDSIYFTNNSETGLNYEWYLGNSQVANSYHTNITFNTPGVNIVMLVVDNGVYRDSSQININVAALPIVNPFILNPAYDSICQWGSTNIYVLNSQTGVSYQFYKDTSMVGLPKIGTGNNLLFNSGSIDSTTQYMVVGSKSNSCGTVFDTSYATVNIYPNLDPNTLFTVSDTTPCYGDTITISFSNSNPAIQYQWYTNLSSNPTSQYGNGGILNFSFNYVWRDLYMIFVVKNSHNCKDTLYKTQQILVDTAIADFDVTPNVMAGDSIFTDNNSVGGLYSWDFGFNTSPSISNLFEPSIIADSSYMSNPIKLVVTAPFGCTDTLVKLINIFDTVPSSSGSYCYMDTLPFHYQYLDYSSQTWEIGSRVIMDQETDNRGNTYISGYFLNSSSAQYPCYFISKIDSSGNLLWDKFENSYMYYNVPFASPNDFKGSVITSISSDCKGNVYVGGLSFSTALVSPDTAVNFKTMFGAQEAKRSFVLKFDSLGRLLWGNYSIGANTTSFGVSDILYVDDNHIYFFEKNGGGIKYTNGIYYGEGIMQINSKGEFIDYGARLYNMDAGDWSMNTHGPLTNGGFILNSPKLHKLSNNDILLTTNFREHMHVFDISGSKINLYSIQPVNQFSGTTYNNLIAVMDKDSMEYKTAFVSHGISNISEYYLMIKPKIEVDNNDNVYIAINYRSRPNVDIPEPVGKNIILHGNTKLSNHHYNTAFIVKFDLQGNLQWHNKLTSSEISDIKVADSSVYLLGNFDGVIGSSSQNGDVKGGKSSGKEMFISSHNLNGDIEWINVIGNNENSFSHAMDVTPCGDIYFSGKAESTIYFHGDSTIANRNLFIGKLSLSNACSSNSCQQFIGGSSCMIDSVFCYSDVIEIQWCSYGDNGAFDISYSLDSGATYVNIVQGYPSINSKFIWSPSFSLYTNQWVMLTIVNPNDSNITDTYWVYLDPCGVGLSEEKVNLKVNVYPNPAQEILNFDIKSNDTNLGFKIYIYDINGKQVLNRVSNSQYISIDVSVLRKGIYFYRVISEESSYAGKVVVN